MVLEFLFLCFRGRVSGPTFFFWNGYCGPQLKANVLLFWKFGDLRDRFTGLMSKLLSCRIAPSVKDIMRCCSCMLNIFFFKNLINTPTLAMKFMYYLC